MVFVFQHERMLASNAEHKFDGSIDRLGSIHFDGHKQLREVITQRQVSNLLFDQDRVGMISS